MSTPEQETELANFPLALRALIEAELAFGNSIVELGHTFPAPPAGAYIKLANKVSTRPRAEGDGLSFYERNNSSYSGEFYDAKRFYFVLEPPNPPPPAPDMDAIRRSLEPRKNLPDSSLPNVALPEGNLGRSSTEYQRKSYRDKPPQVDWDSSQAFSIEESDTGATRVLHFRDKRPPHQLQFALERDVRTLFTPSLEEGVLYLRASAKVVGMGYDLLLRFEAALPEWNCYSLRLDVSWRELSADNYEYYRKTSGSWFESWTSDFAPANRPLANEGSAERYRKLCEEALSAEKHLDSVAAIQMAIIAAMKEGARFYDSHKEGDTKVYWAKERFIRLDEGDDPDERHFTDESEFLKMLYSFCHWQATSHSDKDQLSEIDTWRLILRRMTLPKNVDR